LAPVGTFPYHLRMAKNLGKSVVIVLGVIVVLATLS
jgi:hypothetical protein